MQKNRKGAGMPVLATASLVVIALIMIGGAGWWAFGDRLSEQNSGVSSAQLKELQASAASTCPTDGDTGLTLTVQNLLNDTGAEQFDTTVYITDLDTGDQYTITDTTSPSATTINCGDRYVAEVVSADASDGDNSRVQTIILGGDGASITSEGTVEFVPTKSSYSLRLGISQHGVLQFRAYDNNARDFMCNSDDACNDFELDGVSFESTTNGSALAVGVAGSIDFTLEVQAASYTDNDFNDYYTLILVKAPAATWNEPAVSVDGTLLQDVTSSLTPEEKVAFKSYDYAYKIDKSIGYGTQKGVSVRVSMEAKSGVNPSTDPEVDFASAGRFLSVDGASTKVGAAKDDSSTTATFTVQDVTIDIS